MIQTTKEDKEALKRAKSDAKIALAEWKEIDTSRPKEKRLKELHGVMNEERELPDNYLIFWNHYYVVVGEKDVVFGQVVKSDIQGTVLNLKKDMERKGYVNPIIFNCDIKSRS